MVLVGRIVRPQGNRGEVVVAPDTDFAEARFAPGASVFRLKDGAPDALTVATLRMHDGRAIVGFDGIGSITAAETLRGCELRVDESALPVLGPGRFWHHELIGCRVTVPDEGRDVGTVVRIDDGGVTLLAVDGGTAGEILVPMVDAICRRIDVRSRVIEIAPVDGLLDLNATGRGGARGR